MEVWSKIKFYILRLKKSSLPELFYRLKQMLLVFRLKRLLRKNINPIQVPIIDPVNIKNLESPSFQHQVSKDAVEEIMRGRVFSLNADRSVLRKFEEEFHHVFFADIKQANSSPDIRTVWEPARLQHIAILIAYILQNTESPDSNTIKQYARNAVIKWIHDNPFLFGPNYISAMECGLRIPVFFYCLKLIDNFSHSEFRLIHTAIYLHGWWISRHLSLYSSLGNHTIAECVGLIFAGAIFRKTREGKQWLKKGFNLLKKELDHQILEDGGPREQSLNYHRFVLDLYWLAADFLEKNHLYDSNDFKLRLVQGENFLNAFQDKGGNIPSIGDSDDGCAVAPGISPQRFKTTPIKHMIKVFEHSGYTVISTENKVTFTFNYGPLGMAPLYNHGHADALSVTLSKHDREILADTGTYRYNGAQEFRKYFKGTRAHNTVTIDGLDQAVQETGFIWSRPYTSALTKNIEIGGVHFLQACHDGYARIKEPVRHFRSIVHFDKTNFLVKDTFFGKGVHTFELNYHLHPDSVCYKNYDWWLINNQGAKIYIRLLDEQDFLFVKGQEKPLFGWYSPSYGIKCKSGVLSCTKRGFSKNISFVTAICTESPLKLKTLNERVFQFEQQSEDT